MSEQPDIQPQDETPPTTICPECGSEETQSPGDGSLVCMACSHHFADPRVNRSTPLDFAEVMLNKALGIIKSAEQGGRQLDAGDAGQITAYAELATACATVEVANAQMEASDRARQVNVFAQMVADLSSRVEELEARVQSRIVAP